MVGNTITVTSLLYTQSSWLRYTEYSSSPRTRELFTVTAPVIFSNTETPRSSACCSEANAAGWLKESEYLLEVRSAEQSHISAHRCSWETCLTKCEADISSGFPRRKGQGRNHL